MNVINTLVSCYKDVTEGLTAFGKIVIVPLLLLWWLVIYPCFIVLFICFIPLNWLVDKLIEFIEKRAVPFVERLIFK